MKKKRKQRRRFPEDREVALVSSEIDIEAASAEEPGHVRRFSMTAYTGGAMVLAGWRYPVVVDLAGLTIGKQHRPILLDHTRDVDFVMGQTDRITVENHQLLVAGEVMGDSAKARQVIALADRGFSWQASIGARAGQVEFVRKGKTVKVNGQEFAGPVYVARSATLGEVSFVVLGADENTSAEIAASTNQSEKEIDMEFAEWLEAQGFDSDELTESQTTSLQDLFATQSERTDAATGTVGTGSSGNATGVIEEENPVATLRAELAAETSRVHLIRKTCAGEHGEIEAKAIGEGWDETRTELEVLRATRPQGPASHSEDGNGQFAEGIEAALCMSAGNISEETCGAMFSDKAMEAALSKQLRGVGLHYLMHNVIRAAGKHVKPGLVDNDFIRAAMSADRTIQAAGGFFTISLTGILSNVANKTMLASFDRSTTCSVRSQRRRMPMTSNRSPATA